jgi:hypothetical protein
MAAFAFELNTATQMLGTDTEEKRLRAAYSRLHHALANTLVGKGIAIYDYMKYLIKQKVDGIQDLYNQLKPFWTRARAARQAETQAPQPEQ